MKKVPLLSFFIMVFCIACSKDSPQPDPISQESTEKPIDTDSTSEENPSEPEIYFSYLNEYEAQDFNQGLWIVVHDDQGNLLDFKPYEYGTTIEFASSDPVSDILSISLIRRVEQSNGNKTYRIQTTYDVAKGSSWIITPPEIPVYPEAIDSGETMVLTIENVPGMFELWKTNTLFELGGGMGTTTFSNGLMQVRTSLAYFDGYPDFYITLLDGNNQLKYLRHTYDGSDMVVEFEDFEEASMEISIDIPENFSYGVLEVAGFKDGIPFSNVPNHGAVLQRVWTILSPEIPTQPLKLGYLNDFTRYRTIFSVSWENKMYQRTHYGEPLESLEIPDPQFNVLDEEIGSFDFTTDVTYQQARSTWIHASGDGNTGSRVITEWQMFIPLGYDYAAVNIPDQILEDLPMLNITDLEYASTALLFSLEGGEYNSKNELIIYK